MNSITILIKRFLNTPRQTGVCSECITINRDWSKHLFCPSLFLKDEVKVLGRWNINYCNKSMNYKIDLSNEDHCGPCGQYALIKSKETKKNHLPISKEYKSNE